MLFLYNSLVTFIQQHIFNHFRTQKSETAAPNFKTLYKIYLNLNLKLNLDFYFFYKNLCFLSTLTFFKTSQLYLFFIKFKQNKKVEFYVRFVNSRFKYKVDLLEQRIKLFTKTYYYLEYLKKNTRFLLKNPLTFLNSAKRIPTFKVKFKPSTLVNKVLCNTYSAFSVLFLRKNKVFNKGRYSRNRQLYRTGVYWCLYLNIILVYGLYAYFYKFYFNFGYVWWLSFSVIFAFSFSKVLKYSNYLSVTGICKWFILFFKFK